jgi:hypothetical protein
MARAGQSRHGHHDAEDENSGAHRSERGRSLKSDAFGLQFRVLELRQGFLLALLAGHLNALRVRVNRVLGAIELFVELAEVI